MGRLPSMLTIDINVVVLFKIGSKTERILLQPRNYWPSLISYNSFRRCKRDCKLKIISPIDPGIATKVRTSRGGYISCFVFYTRTYNAAGNEIHIPAFCNNICRSPVDNLISSFVLSTKVYSPKGLGLNGTSGCYPSQGHESY